MRTLSKFIILTLVLLSLPSFIHGISISAFGTAIIVVFFWVIANLVIKPILLLVFLPVNLITLGLFSFVMNAILFCGIGTFVKGFDIAGFKPAFLGALVMSVTGVLVAHLFKDNKD